MTLHYTDKDEERMPLTSPTDTDNQDQGTLYESPNATNPPYLLWACLIVAVISTLNVVLLPFSLHGALPKTPQELENLPYVDQRMGMNRLAASAPSTPTYYRSQPDQIARLNGKYKNAVYGTGTQVVFSTTDVTLMRFVVPLHGGYMCNVAWYPPQHNTMHGRTKVLETEGDVSQIEVWSVIAFNSSIPLPKLDLDTMSWSDRPIRGELLGTLNLNSTPNATTVDFACPFSDMVLIVELRCLIPRCYVKFNQIPAIPAYGFELVRHA